MVSLVKGARVVSLGRVARAVVIIPTIGAVGMGIEE
jgi:hypothetical protein